MPRLLLNRATGALLPYPRQDNEPVAGLDRNAYQVVEVVREPAPTDYDPATHSLQPLEPVISITDPDSGDCHGTVIYGWELIELVPPMPASDWRSFQAQLLQSDSFAAALIGAQQILESELPTAEGVRLQRLLRASIALSNIGALVLAASAQNDPTLFIGAWLVLRQANLVSPGVATGMAQLATACHLPLDLIRSLGAPDNVDLLASP